MALADHACTPECLSFEEEGHEYSLHGFPVLGVNKLLEKVGLAEPFPDIPGREFYARRGTAVHAALGILAKGQEIDESSLHPEVGKFIPCIEEFLSTLKEVQGVEQRILGTWPITYAGTLDLLADGRVYEIKTSSRPADWHRYQAWLYDVPRWYPLGFGDNPHVVYLKPENKNKKFQVVECTGEDYDILKGVLLHAKRRGLIP